MDFRNCLPNVHPLAKKAAANHGLLNMVIRLVRFAGREVVRSVHFSTVAIGRIDASPCVTGRHAPVQRERNGRNRTELNARCSHADIGRGLGRVRDVAECYRL